MLANTSGEKSFSQSGVWHPHRNIILKAGFRDSLNLHNKALILSLRLTNTDACILNSRFTARASGCINAAFDAAA